MKIKINPDGAMIALYTEAINLSEIGQIVAIRRASHIEPTPDNRWVADMTPVSGPVLGPFDFRSQALAAEVAWLEENLLSGNTFVAGEGE